MLTGDSTPEARACPCFRMGVSCTIHERLPLRSVVRGTVAWGGRTKPLWKELVFLFGRHGQDSAARRTPRGTRPCRVWGCPCGQPHAEELTPHLNECYAGSLGAGCCTFIAFTPLPQRRQFEYVSSISPNLVVFFFSCTHLKTTQDCQTHRPAVPWG